MSEIVAMTTNFAGVQAAIQASDSTGSLAARTGGLHYNLNGNSAIMVVDSAQGFEDLLAGMLAVPELGVTATTWREIFGYRVQQVIDGVPQWTTDTVHVAEKTIYHDNWVIIDDSDPMNPVTENQPTAEVIPASSYDQQVPVYDEVARVPGLLELYQSIYPYTDPERQFTVTFGADSVKDILNPEVPQ